MCHFKFLLLDLLRAHYINCWYTSFFGQIDTCILFCVSPCDLDSPKDLQTEDDEVQKGVTTIPTSPEQQPIHTEGKLFQKM